jgi:hypothetical protein
MSTVMFDIATKVIALDQNIWSVFPGLARRFYHQFLQQNVIFLEMPALDLNYQALQDDETLRRHVAMSEAWERYLRGSTEHLPSRRPSDYEPPRGRSFNAAVGNVRNFFARMKPGDFPGPRSRK